MYNRSPCCVLVVSLCPFLGLNRSALRAGVIIRQTLTMLKSEYETRNQLAGSCWNKHWDQLIECLGKGHHVDKRDDNGNTPLQISAALGWTEAVLLLLSHGANIDLSCPLGWTALMQAVRNGHPDIVRILLHAGAKVNSRNHLGWDAVSLAAASGNDALLEELTRLANASELSPALVIACQLGRQDAVKFLLNEQANINGKLPVSGLTPLMMAASGGHADIVKLLLSRGADLGMLNSCNMTALDLALMNGQSHTATMLSLHNRHGFTVRHLLSPACTVPCKMPSYEALSSDNHISEKMFSHQHTPVCHSPFSSCRNAQVFQFPASPYTLKSPSPNPYFKSVVSSCQTSCCVSPHSNCVSPSLCSSPFIPPWMYSNIQWQHKMRPRYTVKTTKSIHSWWKKFKSKCRRTKLKKRIKIYVTFEEEEKVATVSQTEALLHSLDLDYLIPLMRSQEIDAETFKHLRDEDLKELGIDNRAAQESILQKIRSLHDNNLLCNAF